METASRVFDLLDSWRDLPAYQLERRADIYFAVYLPNFLAHRFNIVMNCSLIPEFPVHFRTIYPHISREKDDSCKIDYVALTRDLRQVFFVELKTDSSSRCKDQDMNM